MRQAKIAAVTEYVALANAAEAFEEGFWRDFYRTLFSRTVRGCHKKVRNSCPHRGRIFGHSPGASSGAAEPCDSG